MSYSKGCKPSTPAKVAHRVSFAGHPAASAPLAASADLSAFAPPVMDQTKTGSCTAHSIAGATYTALAAAGTPLGFVPSPRTTYACTRALERSASTPSGELPALEDTGAELQDVATVIGSIGVKPMVPPTPEGANSDVWSGNVNEEPDFAAIEQAAAVLLTGEYKIDPSDASAPQLVAAAIQAGIPVWVAAFVDSAFEQFGANDIAQAPNANDPNGGGHAIWLKAFRTNAQGDLEFLIQNSWGNWALNGCVWASTAWLKSVWEAWPIAITATRVASTSAS